VNLVIHVARKPPLTPMAQNASQWGCAGLNIEGCRVGSDLRFSAPATPNKGTFNASFDAEYKGKQVSGRWPANLILEHQESCLCAGSKSIKVPTHRDGYFFVSQPGTFGNRYCDKVTDKGRDGTEIIANWVCSEGCPIRILDQMSGQSVSPGAFTRGKSVFFGLGSGQGAGYNDAGGASRYFKQVAPETKE